LRQRNNGKNIDKKENSVWAQKTSTKTKPTSIQRKVAVEKHFPRNNPGEKNRETNKRKKQTKKNSRLWVMMNLGNG